MTPLLPKICLSGEAELAELTTLVKIVANASYEMTDYWCDLLWRWLVSHNQHIHASLVERPDLALNLLAQAMQVGQEELDRAVAECYCHQDVRTSYRRLATIAVFCTVPRWFSICHGDKLELKVGEDVSYV